MDLRIDRRWPTPNGGECWLRIYDEGQRSVVLFTELADNEGMSVCNAQPELTGLVVDAFHLHWEDLVVLEFWPEDARAPDNDEEFSRVYLKRITPPDHPMLEREPEWKFMTREAAEDLVGQKIADTPFRVTDDTPTLATADVVDKVTGAIFRFALVEDTEDEVRWYRRLSAEEWLITPIYDEMEYVPEDEDELVEEFCETVDSAKTELVMAVGYCLRFTIEADWMDEGHVKYLEKIQTLAEHEDPETVRQKKLEMFGTDQLF